MLEIDELKADADVLGVKYRSDIKPKALQKKIDKHNGIKLVVSNPVYQLYKNTTRKNIFTEAGRCSPGKCVSLTADESLNYSGLDLCE